MRRHARLSRAAEWPLERPLAPGEGKLDCDSLTYPILQPEIGQGLLSLQID